MKIIMAILKFLLGRGDSLTPSLWSITGGAAHGTIKGLVEARNDPQKVKFYTSSAGRRNDVWLAWDTKRVLRSLEKATVAKDADDPDGSGS